MLTAMFNALLLLALTLDAQTASRIVTVAHRGGIIPGVPENTLAAYRSAIACGVQAIEIDLRGTLDGGIVIMHDPTLDRTTNGKGTVSDHTLAELKSLDAGMGEKIPEYEEVLRCVDGSGVVLLLDIKQSERLDVEKVLDLTASFNATLKVIVGARSVADVRLFKSLNPNIRVLAFMDSPAQIDDFVQAGADIIRLWPEWIEAKPELVGKVHALGRPVWTTAGAADAEALRALIDKGVNGILSDYPALLKELVTNNRCACNH